MGTAPRSIAMFSGVVFVVLGSDRSWLANSRFFEWVVGLLVVILLNGVVSRLLPTRHLDMCRVR